MLLLIDIFSINKGRGYENPSLEIIVTEHCSTGGCPLEEAREHCFLNQSAISVVVLISFLCYCGDYAGYITVILAISSILFLFCILFISGILHMVIGHPALDSLMFPCRNMSTRRCCGSHELYDKHMSPSRSQMVSPFCG
jgi:hypothetical protein